MKKITLILLCLFVSNIYAQYSATYYFSEDFILLNDQKNYFYKATVESDSKKLDGYVNVLVELKNGTLLQKYQYSDLAKGIKKDSTFIFNTNGNMQSISSYNSKGDKISEFAFHENGKLSLEVYYKNNLKNGITKSYYEDGTLERLTNYDNDLKKDTSFRYYESGIIMNKNYYSKGSLKNTYTYNADGNLQYEYGFNSAGDTISTIEHLPGQDDTLKNVNNPVDEKFAEFRGGVKELYKYLSTSITYPREARDYGISGKVVVKFSIDEKGEIENIHVIDPIYPIIDFEAMRVVHNMPAWTPGRQNGKNVSVWFTLPVKFQLQ